MTDEQLVAIRQRTEAATPGPWTYDVWPGGVYGGENYSSLVACDGDEADMLFIAHAREDVGALLDEVERLRKIARVVAQTSLLEVWCHHYPTGEARFAAMVHSNSNIVLDARAALGMKPLHQDEAGEG